MKRIVIYPSVLIFVSTVFVFIGLQKSILNNIFSVIYNEKVIYTVFISPWFVLYGIGCFLISICVAWKYASIMDSKIVDRVKVFGHTLKRKYILIFSIIFILVSFMQMAVFSTTGIHSYNLFSKSNTVNLTYDDINKVSVSAFLDYSSRGVGICTTRTYVKFISKSHVIETFVDPIYLYDIGNILKQKAVDTEVVYTNSCDSQRFNQEKSYIENALETRSQ